MESISPDKQISRRNFLKIGSQASAFLAIGFSLPVLGEENFLTKIDPTILELEINPYILITKAGKITLFNPRPDMGQGTWQALPMLLAEELEVGFDQVEIKSTNGLEKYGAQLSGGSSSVRTRWLPLRKAGAAAKEMLIKAAANQWKVPESECYAENAKVIHKPTKRSVAYADLVDEASKFEIPQNPKLKDPKDFKLLGKAIPRPEIPSKVNGTAKFGIDAKIPGMLYASIQRCPTIHGKIISIDDSETKKIPGVMKVVKTERKMPHKAVEAVAVLGTNYWAALKGKKALKIQWDNTGYDKMSTEDYFTSLQKASKENGISFSDLKGDVEAGLAKSAKKIEGNYETPFAAHAMIEPENAVAWVQGDKAEIWAPVQGPDYVINEVSSYLKIPKENVTVNVLFMGGAFGRKAYDDFVLEAVTLSKQLNAPVKLIWSREDDFTNGPYRPGMLSAMRGGIDEKGNVIAFEHKMVGSSIQQQVFGADLTGKPDDWMVETAGEEDSPYAIPNRRQASVIVKTDIPIVWWRSVYSSTTAFGHESFIDELAHTAGKDPLAFRLELLKESPRFINVLKFLAEKSSYGQKLPAGKARGIAVTRCFGTIAACCITISKVGNGVKIEKVVEVIDCGMTVNPNNVEAQTQGNVVMGLSAAIKPGITFLNGETQETNFHQYQILRMNEIPPMEIYIVPSTEQPSGVGEPGLPPIAPALGNAIFNLTGKRIRKLPFNLDEV